MARPFPGPGHPFTSGRRPGREGGIDKRKDTKKLGVEELEKRAAPFGTQPVDKYYEDFPENRPPVVTPDTDDGGGLPSDPEPPDRK